MILRGCHRAVTRDAGEQVSRLVCLVADLGHQRLQQSRRLGGSRDHVQDGEMKVPADMARVTNPGDFAGQLSAPSGTSATTIRS